METSELEECALRCRREIVKMVHRIKAGHPGGSLSAIDILVALYKTRMNVDASNPDDPERDRFVMSKGHASPAVYAILNEMGFLSEQDLNSFRTLGGVCQGHVDMKWTPGVDFSAGSLGMGLSFGLGCSLAASMDGSRRTTYVMLGDGEIQEGQIWEAAIAAVHHQVGNLKVIIDRNRIQNDDFVEQQMRLFDVGEKFRGFGWAVRDCDGHDFHQILDALDWMDSVIDRPAVIIAHTVKGKGVSYMEDNPAFHGAAPSDEQFTLAMEELA